MLLSPPPVRGGEFPRGLNTEFLFNYQNQNIYQVLLKILRGKPLNLAPLLFRHRISSFPNKGKRDISFLRFIRTASLRISISIVLQPNVSKSRIRKCRSFASNTGNTWIAPYPPLTGENSPSCSRRRHPNNWFGWGASGWKSLRRAREGTLSGNIPGNCHKTDCQRTRKPKMKRRSFSRNRFTDRKKIPSSVVQRPVSSLVFPIEWSL